MLFWRVKPLDQILENAEKKSLKRQLGALQLTLLGIGAIIGTGIFVLTSVAAQSAGPAMMISFVIAAVVCALAALSYAELASMVPVSGSAYTYTYAVLGELAAWVVGWALVLEYAVAAGAVSVGWSGYMHGILYQIGIQLPPGLMAGPFDTITVNGVEQAGTFNVLAAGCALMITGLLILGTSKSAAFNAFLVVIKLVALGIFIAIALPAFDGANFAPFMPNGFWANEREVGGSLLTVGVTAAAATIFFAYVGFDAVSTAAEETKNPQRNMPIGILGSLGVCTLIYLLVAAAATGAMGAQPDGALANSKEPLALVLRELGFPWIGTVVAVAAGLALPSVVLMMLYGQTRIFFVMSRDGLLPERLSKVHPKYHTPHIITMITGTAVALFAGMFPVRMLADISNSGTLFAFAMVAAAVLILRRTEPNRPRAYRVPMAWLICPLAIFGCLFLFLNLSGHTELLFLGWTALGLVVYFLYGYRKSQLARSA
ncbi:MAG: amino acid permease [Xanthomonadales bacterium]|nr:amino acid permease [Xanthomonadales bacterium]